MKIPKNVSSGGGCMRTPISPWPIVQMWVFQYNRTLAFCRRRIIARVVCYLAGILSSYFTHCTSMLLLSVYLCTRFGSVFRCGRRKCAGPERASRRLKSTRSMHVSCRVFSVASVASFPSGFWVSVVDLLVQYRKWKKRSERRNHCALAVIRRSQKFSPAADPLPGGAGRPKFNQLEMVTTFTYRPSLVRIDARNFELSW